MNPAKGQNFLIGTIHRIFPMCRVAATMVGLLVPVLPADAELGDISSGDYYARPWETPADLIFTGPSGCVGGSHETYAIRDADGHVLRTISLPITAYDVVPTNLRFNHDEYASDHDAINLRRNGTVTGAIDLTGGELTLGGAVPVAVDRLTGEGWRWQTLAVNGHSVPPATFCTNGPSVAYSIFAEPLPPWTNAPNHVQNAWTEALDYVSEVSQCLWTGSPESLMNVLTSHFFDGTLYKYSFTEPIPHFFIESNQSFDLSRYLVRPSSLNPVFRSLHEVILKTQTLCFLY